VENPMWVKKPRTTTAPKQSTMSRKVHHDHNHLSDSIKEQTYNLSIVISHKLLLPLNVYMSTEVLK